MPYMYLEDEAIADIAFKVKASTLDELFKDAGLAVCNLQTDLSQLKGNISISIDIKTDTLEKLLYKFLDEIIYLKDADLFFPKNIEVSVSHDDQSKTYWVKGKFIGCEFDYEVHQIGNDIKAITYHDFYIKEINDGWECYVLVDI